MEQDSLTQAKASEAQHRSQGTDAIATPIAAQEIARGAPEDVSDDAAKRALDFAARKTRAAVDSLAQRAAGVAQDQGQMSDDAIDEMLAARKFAAVEQASQVVANYSPAQKKSSRVPTAQALSQPGISPPGPPPTAPNQAPIPSGDPHVEQGVQCQKFLYEVANQTAKNASAQLAAALSLANTSQDAATREEARGQAEVAQRNMELAKQMAQAAQSPVVAAQAVAAIQRTCGNSE